jgi:hypothetical protein
MSGSEQHFGRRDATHRAGDLEDRGGAQAEHAVGRRGALREEQRLAAAQEVRLTLDPGALPGGAEEIERQVHRRREADIGFRLGARGDGHEHVGEGREHAAMRHAAWVAMPLLDAEAHEQALAAPFAVERTDDLDEAGGEAQRLEAVGNARGHDDLGIAVAATVAAIVSGHNMTVTFASPCPRGLPVRKRKPTFGR